MAWLLIDVQWQTWAYYKANIYPTFLISYTIVGLSMLSRDTKPTCTIYREKQQILSDFI